MSPTFGAPRTVKPKGNANVHHRYDYTTDLLLLRSVPVQLEMGSHAKHDRPSAGAAPVEHQMGIRDVHIDSTEQVW